MLEEITNFLVVAPSAEEIIAFKPSQMLDERLHYLLDQNAGGQLEGSERAELDEFLLMRHFLKMLTLKISLVL